MNWYIKYSLIALGLFTISFIALWQWDSYQYDKDLQADFDRETHAVRNSKLGI